MSSNTECSLGGCEVRLDVPVRAFVLHQQLGNEVPDTKVPKYFNC